MRRPPRFLPDSVRPLECRALPSGNPVVNAYESVLSRPPTAAELSTATVALGQGTETPQAFLLSLYQSTERELNQIDAASRDALGRVLDPATRTALASWMSHGASDIQVRQWLLGLPEYAAGHPTLASEIDGDFQVLLGRPAGPGEQALFQGWVRYGANQNVFSFVLVSTPEAAYHEINDAALEYLGRPADSGMVGYYTPQLATYGNNPDFMRVSLILSPEGLRHVGLDAPIPPPPVVGLGPENVALTSLAAPDFAALFAPAPTAPELQSNFTLDGSPGTIYSQVFVGLPGTTAAGLYAYVYEVSSPTLTSAAFHFGDTPQPLSVNGALGRGALVTGGIGALPQSTDADAPTVTWLPSVATGAVLIDYAGRTGISPAVVLYSNQAPRYETIVSLSGATYNGGYAVVYGPNGGPIGGF